VVEAILKIAEILFNDVYDCIRVEVGQEWRAAGSDEPIPDALMTSSGTSTVFMTFQGKYYTNFMTSQDRYFQLGCPSKLVSIRNNRNWNRNLFRHYPKQNVCFGCFASIPKQRVSMFRLNRNKQKTNRNSLIGSIFCNF
jgi:hypothetical protein